MDIVRLGIVGIGNMGSAHARAVFDGNVEGMCLTAVCGTKASRLAWAEAQFGSQVKRFEDYQDMIASSEVDAVLIAVPHKMHPVIAIKAFEAGKHVLTEKPAGIDTQTVRQMNRAAEKSGAVFGIMYNQRTNPLFQALRAGIREGRLGELKRMVWIVNNWYRTQAYYDSGDWRGTWSGEGGGVLLNQCPHNLDLWQWIMGMPVRIRAFCRNGLYHEIQVEDDVTIYAEYENQASAVFITSTGEYPGTNRLEISGTRGKAVLEKGELTWFLLSEDEREMCRNAAAGSPRQAVTVETQKEDGPGSGHVGILQNFADAVRKGTPLLAPGEEGLNGLMISNAAYLSSWSEDWVSLPVDEAKFLVGLKKMQENEWSRERLKAGERLDGIYSERWMVRW